MSLPSIIIAAIIFSIMSMGVFNQSSFLLDIQAKKAQMSQMQALKNAVLLDYDSTGLIEKTVVNLDKYSYLDFTNLEDMGKGSFHILDNSGTPFTFNSSGQYAAVIMSSYADGLNSSIDANNLEIRGGEDYLLISNSELSRSKRGLTKLKVDSCNVAVGIYTTTEGSSPTSVQDLVAGYYLDGKSVIDEFGSSLLLDGSSNCYSSGVNGIDNSKLVDDIA